MSRNKWSILLVLVIAAGVFDVLTWGSLPRDARMQDASEVFAANPDSPWLLLILKVWVAAILVGAGLFAHFFAVRQESRMLLLAERAAALAASFAVLAWSWGALSNVTPGLWWPGA